MSVGCEIYDADVRKRRKGECDACGGDPIFQLQGYPLCLECAVKCVKATSACIALEGSKAAKAARRELEVFFGVKRKARR